MGEEERGISGLLFLCVEVVGPACVFDVFFEASNATLCYLIQPDTSRDEPKEKAREQELPWIEIDTMVYETYEMIPRWKRVLLLLSAPIAGLFLFGLLFTPVRWGLNR